MLAGAVVEPGSLELAAVERAKALAAEAQRAYEAALSGLPEDVRAEVAPGTVPGDPDAGKPSDELDITGNVDVVLADAGRAAAAQELTATPPDDERNDRTAVHRR